MNKEAEQKNHVEELTGEQARQIIKKRIEIIQKKAEGRCNFLRRDPLGITLYTLKPEVFSDLSSPDRQEGKMKTDKLRELGIKIMEEHGMDQNKFEPGYRDPYSGIEFTFFPSQKSNNLCFLRIFYPMNKITQEIWRVADDSPILRLSFRRSKK